MNSIYTRTAWLAQICGPITFMYLFAQLNYIVCKFYNTVCTTIYKQNHTHPLKAYTKRVVFQRWVFQRWGRMDLPYKGILSDSHKSRQHFEYLRPKSFKVWQTMTNTLNYNQKQNSILEIPNSETCISISMKSVQILIGESNNGTHL